MGKPEVILDSDLQIQILKMFHKEPKNVNNISKMWKFGDKKQFVIGHSAKIYYIT